MRILRAYRYLYYRIYSWNLRTWGESDQPQFNAMVGVSVLLFFNILNLALVFEIASGISLLDLAGITETHIAVIGLALMALNYFIFLKNENYKKLAREFEKENTRQRRNGFIFCLLFVIGSFLLFFLMVAIIRPVGK